MGGRARKLLLRVRIFLAGFEKRVVNHSVTPSPLYFSYSSPQNSQIFPTHAFRARVHHFYVVRSAVHENNLLMCELFWNVFRNKWETSRSHFGELAPKSFNFFPVRAFGAAEYHLHVVPVVGDCAGKLLVRVWVSLGRFQL